MQSLQAELGIQNPDVKRLLQKSNEVLLLHYRGIAESLRMPPGQSQAVHEDESVPDVLSRIQEPLSTVKTLCDGVQNNGRQLLFYPWTVDSKYDEIQL